MTTSEKWEDQLNKIWSRAHMPDYSHDAKTAIRSLIITLLQAERYAIEDEIQRTRESLAVDNEVDTDSVLLDLITFIRFRKEQV